MTSSPSVHAIVDSPVLALEGNILWQFENLSEFGAQTLKMQVAHGTLSGEIALDMSAAPPEGPGVTRQGEGVPEMHVKLSHLEILWAFIYGWMVVYEESVQKPQLDPTKVMDAETVNLVDRARELLGKRGLKALVVRAELARQDASIWNTVDTPLSGQG